MSANESAELSLRAENAELRARLEEAEDLLRAIRSGGVDALVVQGDAGPQLFTLQGHDAEQSRFRGEMLSQVSDAVIATDVDDRVTFINAAAERLYGVRSGDLLGGPIAEVFTHPWEGTDAVAAMRTALRERGEWRGELRHRTHNGRELYVEKVINTLFGLDGNRTGQVAAIRDVTSRMKIEQEKAEALRLLDTLLTHAPVGFVFLDRDLRFVRINERLAEMNGYSVAAHLGRTVAEILPMMDATLREVTAHILATGKPVLDHEFSGETAREPGVTRYWSESWYPVPGESGEIIGFGAVVEEITRSKEAKAALRLSNERFDLAVKCSQVTLWQQDLDLRFTWLHNTAPGIDRSDAVGKRDADLLERAEDAAVIVSLKREVIRSGVGMRREFFPQIQGVGHCFEVLMEPLRDAAGLITGITGASTDISERKRAEQARLESGRQYRALAEASSEVAYRMSADWSTMLPLDGRHLVPSSDQPLADWAWLDQNVPRDEHPRVRQEISNAIARKTLFELEHRVRRPDGSDGWTLSRAVPILDENEGVIAWFGAASDITRRKQAEEALEKNEKSLRYALQAAAAGIWDWDIRSGDIVWSHENYQLYDVDPAQGPPRYADWESRVFPEDRDRANANVRAVLEGREPEFRTEFRILSRQGAMRWLLGIGRVEYDGDGQPLRMSGLNLDITERKRAEDALRDSAAMLASSDRRKDAFLATLSHELRNPLGVIGNSLHLLQTMEQDRGAVQQGCARMQRQVGLMKRLIDDLMDISRINQDKLTLQTELLDLATVAQSALENSRTVLDQRGHTVTFVLPPQPIKVDGDATRLAQVVSNMLTNAAKYSDPGSAIGLTVEQQGDLAAVAVRDRGIGIAPDDLRRVFELFAQVSSTANLAQGGLGIGLNLVKRVVELHRGSVEARSDGLGHGSEFLVLLPLASAGGLAARSRQATKSEVASQTAA